MKHTLCYLRGSMDFDLHLRCSTSNFQMTVYTDANWVGCPETRRSTSGYIVFLSDNLISWSSKRWNIIS
jgi:hypothetical protein